MIHGQSRKNRVFDGVLRDLWKRADVICLCMRKFDIRSFQKRNLTQSTKCYSLNLALIAPTAQANIFRQNPADWQQWPVDNSNN
jgi:hypothetical protein